MDSVIHKLCSTNLQVKAYQTHSDTNTHTTCVGQCILVSEHKSILFLLLHINKYTTPTPSQHLYSATHEKGHN